jgi:CO/xanthine dehydrogenase Mo-binding subunit
VTALSRRAFLQGSGALVVTFGTAGIGRPAFAQGPPASTPGLDAWIAIGADGRVNAYTGKCELGQGLFTAQTQLVAEELRVPIECVTLVQCDTGVTPDQGVTSGAQSHPTNFNRANLALAAATAREELVRLASARLGMPADQLTADDGAVHVTADRSRRVEYATLVGGRKFERALDPAARRRPPRQWTVLGTPVRRLELPAMVTGRFEFVHNVRVPGMLHGQVIRPPSVGATLRAVDEGSIRGLTGVVKVVVKKDFVGVVAEKPWQALQAARALKVDWAEGAALPAFAGYADALRAQPSRDTLLVDSRDVDATLAGAATVVKATYRHPYQMHGSIGSSCAVADVRADQATIWSATQGVYPHRATAALLLGLPPEKVHVVFRTGAGCYGLNGAEAVSFDAALLSQAVGRPVRVQLTRHDEMAWENFGSAFLIDLRAGLDAQGNIVAWDHEAWTPNRGGRPGGRYPGNVITGVLAGFEPAPFAPRSPAPAPEGTLENGSNAVPSYVVGRVGASAGGTGTIASERVLVHSVRSPFFTGPLRSPQRLQNTFAHESFMDELAARAKADPVAYRLRHLRDPRLRHVLTAATQAAQWEPRTAPIPAPRRSGIVRGRGVACVLYEGDNGYCAMVADVDVDQGTGAVRVTRLVVALDCGPISNPDGVRAQVEGGALQGVSRALREEVRWDERKVTTVDWNGYPSLALADAMPAVETILVDQPDAPVCGAGETSITVTAAAIGNAVCDATGARLRQIPFTPDRVRAALAAPQG